MSLLCLVKPLAYISLPVFLLRTASKSSPLVRYYVRLGLYLSALGICSVWGVISSVGMTLIGRRFDINWVVARSFYNLASRLLGIYIIEVEGEEHLSARPAVIVANHQSLLDILYVGRILPKQASITSKKELQWMPFLGQFMTLSGAVFIDRKNNARAVQSVAAAGQLMKQRKISIWVFPEGTRTLSEKPDLLPFKKGAFHLAVQAGVPVIPVICQNYWHLYHKGTFESGTLKLKVLPPIPTAGLTASDVGDLAVTVREQMVEALREISGDIVEAVTSTDETRPVVEPSDDVKEALGPSPPDVPISTRANEERDQTPVAPVPALAVDTSTPQQARRNGSDRGPETESDDGMVLVDRPDTPSDAARGF